MIRSLLLVAIVAVMSGCASVKQDGYAPVQWHKNKVAYDEIRALGIRIDPARTTREGTVGFKYFDGRVYHVYAPDASVQGRAVTPVVWLKWNITDGASLPIRAVRAGDRCDVYAPDPPMQGKTYRNGQWAVLGALVKSCFDGIPPQGFEWGTLGHEVKHVFHGEFHD